MQKPQSVGPHGSCALAKPPICALGGAAHSFHDLFLLILLHFPQFLHCTIIFSDSLPVAMQVFTQSRNRCPAPQLTVLFHALTPALTMVLLYVVAECVWKYCTACSHMHFCTVGSRCVKLWCLSDFTGLNIGG